jgi:hypothetical protein
LNKKNINYENELAAPRIVLAEGKAKPREARIVKPSPLYGIVLAFGKTKPRFARIVRFVDCQFL